MTEPETADGRKGDPKPWPLHEKVVTALKELSSFAVILSWGLAASIVLILMAGSTSPAACSGFSCSPVLGSFFAAVVVVLPVLAMALGMLVLMTLLRFSLTLRLWTSAVAPPVGFFLMALILG